MQMNSSFILKVILKGANYTGDLSFLKINQQFSSGILLRGKTKHRKESSGATFPQNKF
jgi:hypothetical protein